MSQSLIRGDSRAKKATNIQFTIWCHRLVQYPTSPKMVSSKMGLQWWFLASHLFRSGMGKFQAQEFGPNAWPKFFFESRTLKLQTGTGYIECGAICQVSSTFCNVFYTEATDCFLGTMSMTPSPIMGPQSLSKFVFVDADRVGDLTIRFNSLTGVRTNAEWIRSMESYVDLPPGSTVNDCLFQCLFVVSPCEIAIFETGRCHFGVDTLQGASNVSDIVVPDSTWDIYFSPKFRDWYSLIYPKELVANATGSHWSKHVYATVNTPILEMCHIFCNFNAQYQLHPCQSYTFDNDTSKCYLGNFAESPAVYGEIDLFIDTYVLPDALTNMTDTHFTAWPVKGFHANPYLYMERNSTEACSTACYLDHKCAFYLISGSVCYLGDAYQDNSSMIITDIDPNDEPQMFINQDYASSTTVIGDLFVGVDLPLRIYGCRMVQSWDNMGSQEECATYCLAGYGYDPSDKIGWPCQIFIYDNVTQQCHVGNLEFKDLTFTNASDAKVTVQVKRRIIEDLLDGNDFTTLLPDPTWNKRFYHEVASEEIDPFQCAAYCILDTGPCNIMGWGPPGACYLGDWYIDTDLFSPPFLAQVIHRTPQLGVILGGQDEVGENLRTSDVFDEFRTPCKYPAVLDIISQGLSSPAVTYVPQGKFLLLCGGKRGGIDPLQDKCYKFELDIGIPEWVPVKDYPMRVSGLTLSPHNDMVYGVGGETSMATFSNEIFESANLNEDWASTTMLNQARGHHCTVIHQEEIWIIGGLTDGNEILDSTEVFNIGSKSIRTDGRLVNPRHGHVCGLIRNVKPGQDWIWVIGGTGPSGFHDTIQYFDVQDNTVWRVLMSTVPSYETESLLPEAWSNIGSSHNGLIQFGAERYFLVSGERQLAGVMDSNIAFWRRDVGQFHGQTSSTMSTARIFAGITQIPLHTRWNCMAMGNEWVQLVVQTNGYHFLPSQLSGYGNTEDVFFSDFSQFDSLRSCDGNYHFRLVWPDLGYFNEWLQTNDITKNGPVTGYRGIGVKFHTYFGGLFYVNQGNHPPGHPDHTYFKGDVRTEGFYAVGRFSDETGYIPGPVDLNGDGISVPRIILYIKRDC